MAAAIENLPVEVARRITIHLHPDDLPDLLAASITIRRLFAIDDTELAFASRHMWFHDCHWAIAFVPLWRLPDAYAVSWLLETWEKMECCGSSHRDGTPCVGMVFPDLQCKCHVLEFGRAPHRPHAWMERVMLKVLSKASLEKRRKCIMALKLAALLDSVPMVELVLSKLFPKKPKKFKENARLKGPEKLTVAFNIDSGAKCTFPWSLAYVATWAATDGATHVLDYALHHPLHPVAYTLAFGSGKGSLIHKAATTARSSDSAQGPFGTQSALRFYIPTFV
ncbi:hypothetical protein HDU96_007999 [Phlyctochytrium bullatum]|nr:hypothetical protein HDU96_007999 [Phlyctochytrium bullatum]